MFDKLKNLLSGDEHSVITASSELKRGRVTIRGTIHSGRPATSPVFKKPCAAFYYRATYTTPSRLKGYIRQKLRDALVYGEELTIEVEGARVAVVCPKHESFSASDHNALKEQRYQGFIGKEQRVDPGATVLATGSLKQGDGGWLLKMKTLEKLEAKSNPTKQAATKDEEGKKPAPQKRAPRRRGSKKGKNQKKKR